MATLYDLLDQSRPASRMGMIEGEPEYDPWSMQAARLRARYPTRLPDPRALAASQGAVGFGDLPGFPEARQQAMNVYAGENYNPSSLLQMAMGAVGAPGMVGGVPAGALGSGVGRRAAATPALRAELTAAEKAAPYEGAKFSQYAEEYPPVGPPSLERDPKTGKEYYARTLPPESVAFQKARERTAAQMKKESYTPYFDPEQRSYPDPSNYPPNVETANITPKKQATIDNDLKTIGADETRQRLQDAYARGQELGNAEDWYAMGQLEKQFIKELGAKEGRAAFRDRFATGMATTTAGNAPTPNLLTSQYLNYLRETGQPIPTASTQMPYPVGGRYGVKNVEQFQRLPDFASLGEANPKRHNFAQNFLGNRNLATIDEQMTQGMTPGLGMPPPGKYGLYENVVRQEAAKRGVPPANFQDVAWAGFKNEPGKPMISHVNDAIERTHRLTGMPRDEIVRRGLVRSQIPIYGVAGAAAAPLSLLDILSSAAGNRDRPSQMGRIPQ